MGGRLEAQGAPWRRLPSCMPPSVQHPCMLPSTHCAVAAKGSDADLQLRWAGRVRDGGNGTWAAADAAGALRLAVHALPVGVVVDQQAGRRVGGVEGLVLCGEEEWEEQGLAGAAVAGGASCAAALAPAPRQG